MAAVPPRRHWHYTAAAGPDNRTSSLLQTRRLWREPLLPRPGGEGVWGVRLRRKWPPRQGPFRPLRRRSFERNRAGSGRSSNDVGIGGSGSGSGSDGRAHLSTAEDSARDRGPPATAAMLTARTVPPSTPRSWHASMAYCVRVHGRHDHRVHRPVRYMARRYQPGERFHGRQRR